MVSKSDEWPILIRFATFPTFHGKPLKFYPNDRDLPDFVHSRHRNVKGGLTDTLVSLETPVLYFYTDRDRTVSVQVDFPKGTPVAQCFPIRREPWSTRTTTLTDEEAGRTQGVLSDIGREKGVYRKRFRA